MRQRLNLAWTAPRAVRPRERRSLVHAWAPFTLMLLTTAAFAQDSGKLPPAAEEAPAPVSAAPPPAHPQWGVAGPSVYRHDDFRAYLDERVWIFSGVELQVKAGTVHLMDGFFEDRLTTGYTIQVAARQPIPCEIEGWLLFGELGGGYMENDGKEAEVTEGTFFDPDFTDLRRASVHAAFGGYWFPASLNAPDERRWHVHLRAGARLGHLHAEYEETVFPTTPAKETDILVGLFGSVGVGWTCHDVRWACFPRVDITFAAELELGHDWFDLGAFGAPDHGLGFYAPMLSLSFTF